jgi:hypothetical protein
MRPLLAAALAAVALLLAAPAPVAAGVAEFVPSVVMTNFGEMGGPCFAMVDKAAGLNANSIKFVPTVHYWGSAERIDKYCYRWVSKTSQRPLAARGPALFFARSEPLGSNTTCQLPTGGAPRPPMPGPTSRRAP